MREEGERSITSLILDHTVTNILRMLKASRMPRTEHGPLSWGFVGNLLILLTYGLIILFSASYSTAYYNYSGDIYHFIRSQTIYAGIGLLIAFGLSHFNYRALRYMAEPLYYLSLIFLVLVLFMPTDVDGFHRWFRLFWTSGPQFQPSEIAKFSMILWVAAYTDAHYEERRTLRHGIIGPVAPLLPVIALLWLEPHKSATFLTVLIIGTMLVFGGCGLKYLPFAGVAGAGALGYLLLNSKDYSQVRLGGVWGLNVSDTANMGWQTKQGLYAISSGGLFGVGIGNSTQKHLWLPYAENDFIFSVLCEELGFVGAMACLILFALLIIQGILIALRAPDYFGAMLGLGITAQIAWHTFCHIGVNTALLPNTGVTLPFFSSGGSSILVLLSEMGILFSISRAGNARMALHRQRERAELDERLAARQTYRRRTGPSK